MSDYARGTTVEVYASQLEVMKLLSKFGIKKHAFFSDESGAAAIAFERNRLSYRISIEMPNSGDAEFTKDRYGHSRPLADAVERSNAECRRRWRCLVLIVKAKLVAVEDHVTSFEKEFMAYAVVDGHRTLADVMVPQLIEAAETGRMPALALPGRSA